MKINITIGLETDGDYRLNNELDYHMEYDGSSYYHSYVFADTDTVDGLYNFEDDNDIRFGATWRACNLLEQMLCDLHVIYTHHYVLDYLYHMFDDAIEAIGRRETHFEASISGNYDGTFISIDITEE